MISNSGILFLIIRKTLVVNQLLICFLLVFHIHAYSKEINKSFDNQIQKSEILISAGKYKEAQIFLYSVIHKAISEKEKIHAAILIQKINHENGNILLAEKELKNILNSDRLREIKNGKLRALALLTLADCVFSFFKMEYFKQINDTISNLIDRRNTEDRFQLRYYLNNARYYAYQVNTPLAKMYLDSAEYIYNQLFKAKKLKYKYIQLLTVRININRNLDPSLNFQIVKYYTLNHRLYKDVDIYDQIHLWRAIGNFWNDRLIPGMKENKIVYQNGNFAFDKAERILHEKFPYNKYDLINILNLKGLMKFRNADFSGSDIVFKKSKKILDKNILPDQFLSLYINNLEWSSDLPFNLFKNEMLLHKLKNNLSEWKKLIPYWTIWVQNYKNNNLFFYKDIYIKTPYQHIVKLCYDIYQINNDKRYIDTAFSYQEDMKKNQFTSECVQKKDTLHFYKLSEIQNRLKSDEAVISFSDIYSIHPNTYAIIISFNKIAFTKLPLLTSIANQKNEIEYFKDRNSIYQHFHNAYIDGFKPIDITLDKKIKNIYILLSASSSVLNFGMLALNDTLPKKFKDFKYLFEKYNFIYNYTYDNLIKIKYKDSNNVEARNCQVYIPDYTNTTYFSLPYFQNLGSYLQKEYDFKVFGDTKASVLNFTKESSQADLLHICAHGFSDITNPLNQKIIFNTSKDCQKESLTSNDIIKLKLHSKLTILNVCESNISDPKITESQSNIAYWFFQAGSRSCLYSFWNIDDKSTSFIMKRFYKHLLSGESKSESLRKAKSEYNLNVDSDDELNPIYWGGLIVTGDDSPLTINSKAIKLLSPDWKDLFLFISVLIIIISFTKEIFY